MSTHGSGTQELTPELLLRAYAAGIFPMAEHRDDPTIFWVDPQVRGVMPLGTFHVPRRLKKIIRSGVFEVRCDTAFAEVLKQCGEAQDGRPETWINAPIEHAVNGLFEMGFAHSVETWQDGKLVGGLYGIALGGAFFGESMFSRVRDASKASLVHLVARLRMGGFTLLDIQFITDHLRQFGAEEVPARQYLEDLNEALKVQGLFPVGGDESGAIAGALEGLFLQSSTQTS
ncbi:MAG: leucyl/phenylalanyl-tRNA--protein transferase [Alphaproteobacteria bacterium]|nr:leucyl/phenylalanyl-tRNA--protein transferase [Alphaproteobacteria bacterium]MBT7943844.1 leucyl/phenylalanyl-tRNA--protein transferase [Alphaproteobacteria bacterium]